MQEPKTISVTDFRIKIREIMENAHFRGQRYLVERSGQGMVVVLGVEDYRRLLAAYAAYNNEAHPCVNVP